jgi:phosphonate transport system ATP-binding protein
LPADTGSVSLGTGDASKIGVVFQHLRLTGNLSVLTNVLCGGLGACRWWQTLFGFSTEEKLRAYEIITELGLAPLTYRPVRSISGGEKQRTAIARVLFQGPDIILADEPTSSLDPQLAVQVMERLRSLCRKEGRSVIAVLHERGLVERFADIELALGCSDGKGWKLREIG